MNISNSKLQPVIAIANKSALLGEIILPGDKSISHRALMFGAIASGTTKVKGLLEGEDVLATANAMRQLGARITKTNNIYHIEGVGEKGLSKSQKTIDFGNAGTGVRLCMGLVSAYDFSTKFSGDASLSSRPMGRVLDPLKSIGVEVLEDNGGKLPITIRGAKQLEPINYQVPMASAQVKSAVLLAGLNSKHKTIVIEKIKTRDHTEKMLQGFGAKLSMENGENGAIIIEMEANPKLIAQDITVPGDPSSAAFAIVAATIIPNSDVLIKNTLMNPTRAGLIKTLIEMGANIQILNSHISGGEEIADVRVRYAKLKGVEVPAKRAPSMIDEYPILAVAAAFADGTTKMFGIGEMRVKETDRLALMAKGLKANGVDLVEGKDYLIINGASEIEGGAKIKAHLDHRIAMTFLVLGMVTKNPIEIDDASVIDTSYPSFIADFTDLGASFEVLEQL
ncbi:MAG: 3-phosphoshikimate 1-carboxyvinyltransferase [Devosiaceae bacterium]|nr:3-phosphoshikimate 1-carboxyvinyltransferase [Devosiaceae bacterium]